MWNILILLTTMPAGNEYTAILSTGQHLFCSFPTPSPQASLSLCQGVDFDTPQKQSLQADYRRLLDLKFFDV
jgi:hypothetical protein